MLHVYCISGLGADHRIFNKLRIENAELHFIKWQMPGDGDDMRSYALKLAEQVDHPEIILIGVSFGGMLASEIARHHAARENQGAAKFRLLKTILISSCKHRSEFPALMRFAGNNGLHKRLPYNLLLRNKIFNRFLFDLRSKEEELYLKRMMLQDNATELIRRSIHIILTWQTNVFDGLIHIHGTADRLLGPKQVKADFWINNGGHFMVWNRADEVSAIVNKALAGS